MPQDALLQAARDGRLDEVTRLLDQRTGVAAGADVLGFRIA